MITDQEVAILNAARTLCRDLAERAAPPLPSATATHADILSAGMLKVRCMVAQDALFDVLNTISSHDFRKLLEEQLHNVT